MQLDWSFEEMMLYVADRAVKMGRVCYLFDLKGKLDYSWRYIPGWLFKAYPGGRTVMSVDGVKFQNGREER
jgi:hypothetical protein